LIVALRTCTVSCCDLKGVEHSVEVTAASLYEAVAQGLRVFRENDWVDDIGGGRTTITVVVRQPRVEHKVRAGFRAVAGGPPAIAGRNDSQESLAGTHGKAKRKRMMERRAEQFADRKGRAAPAVGHFIEPIGCLAVASLPAGSGWEYELKLDGYRAVAFKTRNRVHLMSRNGKDFAQRYPALVHALEPLRNETVADGEIVAIG
jgi:ATP-dependent DNA ligase